ncbi:MAG: hypothetical protein HY231_18115 [Acidobacteria bacterium]|nr:hypothetical protein [Acidobacteriota bacterium]
MKKQRRSLSIILFSLFLLAPFRITAQQENHQQKTTTLVTMNAPSAPPLSFTDLLPDKLAGAKATSELRQYTAENIAELVANQAVIYQEYHVKAAASRMYNTLRVDVFQMATPPAAFGLFSSTAKENPYKVSLTAPDLGSGFVADGVALWKQNYFVKVTSVMPSLKPSSLHASFAAAVTDKIPADAEAAKRPTLFASLPKNFLVTGSEKYFLGPEALNFYVQRAHDMFSFDGQAEAVVAEYRRENPVNPNAVVGATKPTAAAKPAAFGNPTAVNPATPAAKPLKLVIVEYHTPQFATDALNRLNGYVNTLAEDERQRFLVKRVGNFIVEATDFDDRDFAESLVNSIEYPYVVKWLQNPAIPTNDPFRIQKAGQMLVSTFSLIGLTGGIVLLCGSLLGITIFLRRRKQQRKVFSDAGGMIGLHLDPIEDALLGLPPANDRE